MRNKTITLSIKSVKPRNPFSVLARSRNAGRHGAGNQRQHCKRALAQELRGGVFG